MSGHLPNLTVNLIIRSCLTHTFSLFMNDQSTLWSRSSGSLRGLKTPPRGYQTPTHGIIIVLFTSEKCDGRGLERHGRLTI